MFSLFQQFTIIPGGQENSIRQGASSLIVAEMCGNINTNESASSNAGRMRLVLIQLQLPPSIRRSFSLPCSAAAILQAAKARRGVYSLSLAFSAFTGYTPLDYCIYACVMVVIDSLKLWSKNPPFFKKYTWTADLDQRSFPRGFLPHFAFLILEFLKKSVIQELRTRKNGLIKRFSRVGPIITHSRESSNSQRDPQDHAHS